MDMARLTEARLTEARLTPLRQRAKIARAVPPTAFKSCIAMIAVTLTACQARDTGIPTTGRAGGTVVFAAASSGESLFPPAGTSTAGQQVLDQMFESLASLDGVNPIGDAHMTPQLADRWQWAPDSLSIAFHIDPRARWHDGVPVTAAH